MESANQATFELALASSLRPQSQATVSARHGEWEGYGATDDNRRNSGLQESARDRKIIYKAEAIALAAGKTCKPCGVDPRTWFRDDPEDSRYALGRLSTRALMGNKAGVRFDGTMEEGRARVYVAMPPEPTPIVATFGRRDWVLRVIDGGHCVTVVRLNGQADRPVIVRFKPR